AKGVLTPVPEREIPPLEALGHQKGLVSDPPQCHDHASSCQLAKLDSKVCVATADLVGERLVGRRHAFDGVDDSGVPQLQSVIRGGGLGTGGKSQLVERLVEKQPGVVTRERAARAVCAVHSRCEADDEDAGCRSAEGRYRAGEVSRVTLVRFGEELSEAWTARTIRVVARARLWRRRTHELRRRPPRAACGFCVTPLSHSCGGSQPRRTPSSS